MVRAIFIAAVLSGCGAQPAPVGAPSVRVHKYTEIQTYEETVVRDATARDESGELIAQGVTLTVDREEEVESERHDLLVGGVGVSELEFYRAAGDVEAVRRIEARRRGPRWTIRAGLILLGLGAAAVGASVPLGLDTSPGILSLAAGGGAISYGALIAAWGTHRMKAARGRTLPWSRAREAVRRWEVENGAVGRR